MPHIIVTGKSRRSLALNPNEDGTCRTLKAQCGRNGASNFSRTDSFGAGGVLVIEKTNTMPDES